MGLCKLKVIPEFVKPHSQHECALHIRTILSFPTLDFKLLQLESLHPSTINSDYCKKHNQPTHPTFSFFLRQQSSQRGYFSNAAQGVGFTTRSCLTRLPVLVRKISRRYAWGTLASYLDHKPYPVVKTSDCTENRVWSTTKGHHPLMLPVLSTAATTAVLLLP